MQDSVASLSASALKGEKLLDLEKVELIPTEKQPQE